MSKQETAVIDFDESIKNGAITEVVEVEKKEEKSTGEDDHEEEQEEENDDEKVDSGEKNQEQEEEEEEQEDDKKEEEQEDDDKKESEETLSVDDFVKNEYFEKFEVENKEQLDELLETASAIIEENKRLKQELEKSKEVKPSFENEHEQRAFEFLKSFNNLEDGMETMAGLLAMDIEKSDSKLVLERQYLIEHPELTREQAKSKFERIYQKKYTIKDKDLYDSEKEYEDAKEDAELELKIDSERARKFLKQKQTEIKSVEKKSASSENQIPEAVKNSIERNAEELLQHSDGFTELIFSPTDDESDDFKFKLSKEQLKAVRSAAENWVKNPVSYDEKGKFKGNFDPDEILVRTVYAMFGQEVFEHLVDHMHTLSAIKKAEDIGKRKPNEVSKGKADPGNLDEYAQAEHLIKKKKAQGRMKVH